MITLTTCFYPIAEPDRHREIVRCWHENVNNPLIDRIALFCEGGEYPLLQHEKVSIVDFDGRVTYADWIQYCFSNCDGSDDAVFLLANSDIYFDDSVGRLNLACKGDMAACLSRYEVESGESTLHPKPHWSQDSWAVSASSVAQLVKRLAEFDIPLGVPRCDNKIAYQLLKSGLSLTNPCWDVHSHHLHESQVRTYNKTRDDRILGTVCYVHPSALGENSALELDTWVPHRVKVGACTVNFSLSRWNQDTDSPEGSVSSTHPRAIPIAEKAGGVELLQFWKSGKKVAGFGQLSLYEHGELYAVRARCLPPSSNLITFTTEEPTYTAETSDFALAILCDLSGALSSPIVTSIRSEAEQIIPWQFPCNTEERSWLIHQANQHNLGLKLQTREFVAYVGVPWATFIDKGILGDELEPYLATIFERLSDIRRACDAAQIELHVHTVCQHIHWAKLLKVFQWLGVTDLHASHATSADQEDEGGLRLHGWPLVAVNIETPERSGGISYSNIEERGYLCSFIGAHMDHYLDDTRLKIANLEWPENALVEVTTQWHFNEVVYSRQIQGETSLQSNLGDFDTARRYNQVLSGSKFGLCPVGAGPNTLRLWECIALGCIPVVFRRDLLVFERNQVFKEVLKNCVVWDDEVDQGLVELLREFPEKQARLMSRRLRALYPEICNQLVIADTSEG
ncbi:MAG: exostosin family protein [Pseudomonadota bacterium]